MAKLTLIPNIADPDAFFAQLVAAHEGLSKAESDALNARLLFTLANHIGDAEVLDDALAVASAAAQTRDG